MKAATVKQLKDELNERSPNELLELCLALSKFKKENKELLTYLLFDVNDEKGFIYDVKNEIDQHFKDINRKNFYFIKKGVRKILKMVKKYIRYSKKKETEIELMIYFCKMLKEMNPSIQRNQVLKNIFLREINNIKKKLSVLHEDLQYDFGIQVDELIR